MALVNCKECGKEVSSEAIACPNCGIAAPALSATEKADIVKMSGIARSGKLGGTLFLSGAAWMAFLMLGGSPREAVEIAWGSARWLMGLGALWYVIAEIDRNLFERKLKKAR